MNRDTPEEELATSERNFCSKCSSMLWLYDKTWSVHHHISVLEWYLQILRPELIHPFASAIDSPELQSPETMVCAIYLIVFAHPDVLKFMICRSASNSTLNQNTFVFQREKRKPTRTLGVTLLKNGTRRTMCTQNKYVEDQILKKYVSPIVQVFSLPESSSILFIHSHCQPQRKQALVKLVLLDVSYMTMYVGVFGESLRNVRWHHSRCYKDSSNSRDNPCLELSYENYLFLTLFVCLSSWKEAATVAPCASLCNPAPLFRIRFVLIVDLPALFFQTYWFSLALCLFDL